MIRLQKILSAAGVASRRAAEQLMLDGRVSVNGRTVLDLGTKADLEADDIRVDGRRIKSRERLRYVLLHKPRGYVTTRADPQRRPTVLTLLRGVREYVYPVGRLDFDSEGLLILTNDGDLAARLTHPRHEVPRVYEARVRGIPDARTIERLATGVVIDGRRTAPAAVRLLREVPAGTQGSHEQAILEVTIHEGRNRQVRKMCQAEGHPVFALRRTRIGPISDPRLPAGGWRDLTEREVASLRRVATSLAAARASSAPIGETESESREKARGSRPRASSRPAARPPARPAEQPGTRPDRRSAAAPRPSRESRAPRDSRTPRESGASRESRAPRDPGASRDSRASRAGRIEPEHRGRPARVRKPAHERKRR